MRLLIWPLLGLFLCACPGEDKGTKITVITGYEPAVIGNTIYIPENINTSEPPEVYEPKFEHVGIAFRMWAGEISANSTLTPNGNAIVTHKFSMDLQVVSIEQVKQICNPGYGCTYLDGNYCEITVADDYSSYGPKITDMVWGHELGHCWLKHFHG